MHILITTRRRNKILKKYFLNSVIQQNKDILNFGLLRKVLMKLSKASIPTLIPKKYFMTYITLNV